MKPRSRTSEQGVPVGRQREWISITSLAVPTVWMAGPDGLICLDLIAVELAANGLRSGWKLTPYEAAFGTDRLLQRGVERLTISKLLGPDYRTLRNWFPEDTTPLAQALALIHAQTEANRRKAERLEPRPVPRCGTYAGAKRHERQKEPMDDVCREAKRAADRYYRQHGTYVGAPGAGPAIGDVPAASGESFDHACLTNSMES
ncbi:hypothetical protein AB0F46_29365 [Streptomyces sp. NPDC026665]|uniref:hypothetical protein n=1 Tax=Streptomyces sp. NPDC026665 TaxID=3154798 RepID=UPI0033E04E67